MVYIQKNRDGIPHHFDCACAMYGVMDLALDYTLVTMEEVMEGKWDTLIRSRLFVGSVEFMTEVFKRIGINQPRLSKNNLRPEKRMMISDFVYESPVFIKPTSTKLFTGTVIDEYNHTQYKHHYPDAEIIVQDVIPDIISEWRCYIFRNKIVDVKNYSGDIGADVNGIIRYLDNELQRHGDLSLPETFVADVAVCMDKTQKPTTTYHTIIEFNDMWAIGNYGVSNDLYVRMLKQRYFDIIKGISI